MKNNTSFLIETIKDLYAMELIFTDFRIHNTVLVDGDLIFYVPYRNRRNGLINKLKSFYTEEKDFNKVYDMIVEEAEKTLKDNSQDIEQLIKYAIELIKEN